MNRCFGFTKRKLTLSCWVRMVLHELVKNKNNAEMIMPQIVPQLRFHSSFVVKHLKNLNKSEFEVKFIKL